jgi:DNA-binding phage protein
MEPITILEAVKEAGGVTALAGKLGVSRQTVHRWMRENKLPEVYQYAYLANVKRRGKYA